MIIDYDIDSTIGHGRGYPTGLEHEEKMDVIACLLDEGERFYVNDEHTAWICENQCAVGEMVTLDESSICLISTIVLDLVLKGFWKNLSILFSLLIGYLLSLCFKGMVDLSDICDDIVCTASFISAFIFFLSDIIFDLRLQEDNHHC